MADYKVSDTELGGIADKIRAKGGTSALLEFPTGFENAIDAIQTGITPTGTKNISTNGTHDVTNYASANVAVPASAVDSGTKSITANGTHDVVGYASAAVSVPNSYAASDEGKVVQSGALVSQSSQTVTENGTYDTTLKNEVIVDVQGGGSARKVSGTFTIISDANNNNPTITHNFGTKKIAAVIYPVSIAASGGYQMFYVAYIGVPHLIDDGEWTLDFTSYNSAKFPDVVTVDVTDGGTNQSELKDVSRQSSPWTTQSTWHAANNEATWDSAVVLTDDTIKPTYSRWATGTYKYIVFDLS